MKSGFHVAVVLGCSLCAAALGQTPRTLGRSPDVGRAPNVGRVPVGGRFKDLGVAVQFLSGAQGQAVAPRKGRNQSVYTACAETDGPMFILEADPDTGVAQLYPCPVKDDRQVFGFTLGLDNKIYFCTGPAGHLLSFDVKTKKFAELGNPIPNTYCQSLTTGPDGTIYGAGANTMQLMAYDPHKKSAKIVIPKLDADNDSPNAMVFGADGLLYIACSPRKARVLAYNPATGKVADVLSENQRIAGSANVFYRNDGDVLIFVQSQAQAQAQSGDGQSGSRGKLYLARNGRCKPTENSNYYVPTLSDGRMVQLNLNQMILNYVPASGGATQKMPLRVPRGGAPIMALALGPDRKVYGGADPVRLFRLDPKSGKMDELGNPTAAGGQICALGVLQDRLYLVGYPNANLAVYDTSKPYRLTANARAGKDKSANPRDLGAMDQSQLRALEMVAGPDGKLYIALQSGASGAARRTSDAGALAVHDTESGKTAVHHPVPDEQIAGVVLTDEKEIWGASATKLFQWDAAKKAAGTLISAPSGARLAAIAWCGNGKIYAVSAGTPALYAFDLAEGTAVSAAPIPWGQPPSYRRALAAGPDGLVYGIVADEKKNSTLYVVDPRTHQPCKLGEYPDLSAGWAFVGNDIYLGAGAQAVKFTKSF